MKTMTVGEFKARFSDVIELVRKGEEIQVTFGRKKEVVGYFKPQKPQISKSRERVLGPLKNLGYHMSENFCETSEEEFPVTDFPS